jgi:protein-tyrosine phosphatase
MGIADGAISPHIVVQLGEAGIRTFVDLRSDAEYSEVGTPLALIEIGISWVRCPVTGYDMRPLKSPEPDSQAYADVYLSMFEQCSDALINAVRKILAVVDVPVVFGCTAGKDRTGVLAALLLDAAGTPFDAICKEHARSATALLADIDRFNSRRFRKEESVEQYAQRLNAQPEAMALFLSEAYRQASPGSLLSKMGLLDDELQCVKEIFKCKKLCCRS